MTVPKTIALLGSTGSIGTQTLELVKQFSERFSVCGLVAGKNVSLLKKQIEIFRPRWVSVATEEETVALQKRRALGYIPDRIFWGLEGHDQIASMEEAELVVSALVGAVGLRPTLAALRAGKAVALANKETLVMAGPLVMAEARR
ncbi:MAG TPA: 1-deoxy-D-xylulose-5-phosphate reductoisomerase, partial [Thermodesulfobacteriota bacterium]|nr:1-deoxy-D-xylulose-5-phosphate reductoisomerase [Thermodesulfobacteriota bacterium]